ncbi:endonuclease/exonuclease/phosphatase family protein [Reinekea marinisedimentorum]|uniref:Endonuclease/exonuclease/phosphatase family metal-dependent hydrolase n=1 Tax=Reinekea marinisedimentorum TaxID=230495 RepID=A0A4R3IDN0_9GAMM|nr:endonuclease/exonuclease/phosphatase family protein [Reinekea marinisedimentorum]TCS43847.1 endonuclease/exonuclease/phosphatase family metal-dependent hydrolase [Reinekea marinisedimentorum]
MRLSGFQNKQSAIHLEPWHNFMRESEYESSHTLRLLSYNIQVGIHTRKFHDYVLNAWQHVWPSHKREHNLEQIAELIRHFDLIALQEVDGGSFRTKYVNQIHYLAKAANKEYWHQQLNRNLGRFAQHSNAIIGNVKPINVDNHALPGLKGRGAIAYEIQSKSEPVLVVVAHLALGKKTQDQQLKFIHDLIKPYDNVIVMGDMNTDVNRILNHTALKDCNLKAAHSHATYPSWQPTKCFDQILLSKHISVTKMGVLDFRLSDHLPVALEIDLP